MYVKTAERYTLTSVRLTARNPDEVAVEGIAAGTLVTLAEPPPDARGKQ